MVKVTFYSAYSNPMLKIIRKCDSVKYDQATSKISLYDAKHKLLCFAFADEFERIEIEQDGKLTQVII